MHVWNVLQAARWKYTTQKLRRKSPSAHHCTNSSGYIFATKACIDNRKKFVNDSISSICLYNMVNFGPLTAEICWRVWGTPANFNGFASWLHYCSNVGQRRSTKLCSLHDVWPSSALVYYICLFEGSCPLTEFCQLQNSLCVQVLHSPILAALLHGTRAAAVSQTLWRCTIGMELRYFRRGRHLYSAGRPWRWASAHILV